MGEREGKRKRRGERGGRESEGGREGRRKREGEREGCRKTNKRRDMTYIIKTIISNKGKSNYINPQAKEKETDSCTIQP